MPDPTIPSGPFVTAEWLAARLADPAIQVIDGSATPVKPGVPTRVADPAVQVIDASWYLPAQNRNAAQEFADGHIPGAIFLDIDAVADHATGLPHMLLADTDFAAAAGALGISNSSTLVVYDGAGLFSAPRVRWMLRLYGARAVYILDGGLPQWKAEGRPLETGPSRAAPAAFHVSRQPGQVVDLAAVRQSVTDGDRQIVDARSAPRFAGTAPEPRPGLASGHMPGSRNLPFTEVISDGRLKDPEQVRQAFTAAGVDLDAPLIASCGSGVTAAVLVLALETLGKTDVALYDGSWTEYASQPDAAIERS